MDCPYDTDIYNYEPAIAHYRSIEDMGGWPTGFKTPLRLNKDHPEVVILKDRLVATGDLDYDDGTTLFDQHVKDAVKHFQTRHSIEDDGIVGPITRRNLNIPVEKKIQRLQVSKQRWDQIPTCERRIVVNIPAFRVWGIDNDETIDVTMKVVVGKRHTQTPVFNFDMRYMVFNPEWNVPYSINKEVVARFRTEQRRGTLPQYISSHPYIAWSNGRRINILATNWNYPPSNLRFVQQPGPTNPLGQLKFMHWKPGYSIFLHDTPAKHRFNYETRLFSHGCIRLERYLDMLAFVIETNPMSQEEIDRIFASKVRTQKDLTDRLPVYVVYIPSWIDENGTVYFSEDVYGKGG